MRYFIDTEFHEYKKKLLFGKPIDTIELISIGIVSDENKTLVKPYDTYSDTVNYSREYYAICKEFDIKAAWNKCDIKDKGIDGIRYNYWIRDNVLKPIYKELHDKETLYSRRALYRANVYIKEPKFNFTYKNLKKLINKYDKTRKQIAEEIKEFINIDFKSFTNFNGEAACYILEGKIDKARQLFNNNNYNKPEFYAYYADYDWVVFCWLFGRMIDLPEGFPMYCIDLKQMFDEKALSFSKDTLKELLHPTFKHDYYGFLDSQGSSYKINELKLHKNYPKQINVHNALEDAKWNKELYKFIKEL